MIKPFNISLAQVTKLGKIPAWIDRIITYNRRDFILQKKKKKYMTGAMYNCLSRWYIYVDNLLTKIKKKKEKYTSSHGFQGLVLCNSCSFYHHFFATGNIYIRTQLYFVVLETMAKSRGDSHSLVSPLIHFVMEGREW